LEHLEAISNNSAAVRRYPHGRQPGRGNNGWSTPASLDEDNRMKSLPMIVALVVCTAQAAFANPESVEQELSPQELCDSYAKEDGVTEEDYAGYMRDCISSFEELPPDSPDASSMSEENLPGLSE
jgi:hypothetical protein